MLNLKYFRSNDGNQLLRINFGRLRFNFESFRVNFRGFRVTFENLPSYWQCSPQQHTCAGRTRAGFSNSSKSGSSSSIFSLLSFSLFSTVDSSLFLSFAPSFSCERKYSPIQLAHSVRLQFSRMNSVIFGKSSRRISTRRVPEHYLHPIILKQASHSKKK